MIELCVAWLCLLVFVGGCCEVFAVVWKGEDVFVVGEVFTGVATQGGSIEEAIKLWSFIWRSFLSWGRRLVGWVWWV